MEQNFYLSFLDRFDFDELGFPTWEQRMDFLQFDSRGGCIDPRNPIFVGKCRYGQTISMLQEDIDKPWGIGREELRTEFTGRFGGERMLRELGLS